jgi:5-methylcytosine-specific restriction protein A
LVIERAHGRCEQPGCGEPGVEVDHVRAGDDHSLANLQLLCAAHHRVKTLREASRRR